MAKPTPPYAKTPRTRAAVNAGYRKGEETRARILDAALNAFGEKPFKAVTTRYLAEEAGVSLPTLQYYFADKEGLYRACAEEIVARYRRHTAAAEEAAETLADSGSAADARARLKAVIGALAGFLVGSKEAERWAPFVARELRDPGPAFEILYERLWRPGVNLTARLIARMLGRSAGDPAARIQALMLISSALALQSGRKIALRTMGWRTIGRDELAMVTAALDGQIDAIARHG